MSINYSIVQGFVAGGTAAYLKDRLLGEAAEKDATCWQTVALQVNHVLLLTAETLCCAGCGLGLFKPLVQSVYILTPCFLFSSLLDEKFSLSPETAKLAKKAYSIAMVYLSLAAIAVGDPFFGISSLFSMVAFDWLIEKEVHQAFSHLAKIPALCALIGYGSQVICAALNSWPPEFMKIAAVASTILMGIKLCIADPLIALDISLPAGTYNDYEKRDRSYGYYPVYIGHCSHRDSYHDSYVPSTYSYRGGGNLFCRASVW